MAAQISRLIGCNVYISEGRNLQLIRQLESLCKQRARVALANTFVDEPYNRTGLTLVATSLQELVTTISAVAQHALSSLDLQQHIADHPRLGVVDHISLHPLGPEATLQLAATAARQIGQQLAVPPIGLPVYYYGAAHHEGRELAEIRRKLGYFRVVQHNQQHQHPPAPCTSKQLQPTLTTSSSSSSNGSNSCQGDWIGSITINQLQDYPPDAGPPAASPAAGVVTIGAVPWVVNYNVPLYTEDMQAARAVARAVSTRGGGPPGVQAMALHHGPGVVEIATNLTQVDWTASDSNLNTQPLQDAKRSHDSSCTSSVAAHTRISERQSGDVPLTGAGPEEVQAAVAAAARAQGLPPPGRGYVTNKMPQELLEFAEVHRNNK